MSDKMRDEFEAWYKGIGSLDCREADGNYSFQHTRYAWKAWQASRAAMVRGVARGEWTDEQCGEFLSVALRHCNVRGRIVFDEIRQGVSAANSLSPKP